MLTGYESITDGDAWVKGVSIRSNVQKAMKLFGYCPQIDPVLEELTVMNWMEIICLIRGVPTERICDVATSMAEPLGFKGKFNSQVKTLSGGNKRKLCTSLAIIGSPDLVYLDEPTTGMDPNAKRGVWNVLTAVREESHSIVLCTHSMDECEALCTRIIILLDGQMMAIDTSHQLKKKYSIQGHLVIDFEQGSSGMYEAKLKEKLKQSLNGFEVQ